MATLHPFPANRCSVRGQNLPGGKLLGALNELRFSLLRQRVAALRLGIDAAPLESKMVELDAAIARIRTQVRVA